MISACSTRLLNIPQSHRIFHSKLKIMIIDKEEDGKVPRRRNQLSKIKDHLENNFLSAEKSRSPS